MRRCTVYPPPSHDSGNGGYDRPGQMSAIGVPGSVISKHRKMDGFSLISARRSFVIASRWVKNDGIVISCAKQFLRGPCSTPAERCPGSCPPSSKGRTWNSFVLYEVQNRHRFQEQPSVTWKMRDHASDGGLNSGKSYSMVDSSFHLKRRLDGNDPVIPAQRDHRQDPLITGTFPGRRAIC